VDVKVVATVAKGTLDELTAQKGTLIWKFGGRKRWRRRLRRLPGPRHGVRRQGGTGQTNVYDATNYSGRKVDFNVKDIDIKNLLAHRRDQQEDIIVADDVKGTVTIKLRNVPWDQALDIVLKSKAWPRGRREHHPRRPIETLRAEQKAPPRPTRTGRRRSRSRSA